MRGNPGTRIRAPQHDFIRRHMRAGTVVATRLPSDFHRSITVGA